MSLIEKKERECLLSENKDIIDKLANRLINLLDSKQVKLRRTTELTELPDVEWKCLLSQLYKLNGEYRAIASILNAIWTEKKAFFILTKRILDEIMENDANLQHKTLSGQMYKTAKAKLIQNGFIVELYPPTKLDTREGGNGLNKAGGYKLGEEMLAMLPVLDEEKKKQEVNLNEFFSNWKGNSLDNEGESEGVKDSAKDVEIKTENEVLPNSFFPCQIPGISSVSNREHMNKLITSRSKVIIAKQVKTLQELQNYLFLQYASKDKESLTDAQAAEFLSWLIALDRVEAY